MSLRPAGSTFRPPCDAFPFAWFSHDDAKCSREHFRHRPDPPSVTSVTSVRCFPLSRGSRIARHDVPDRSLRPPTPIPLRGLRDLRAMLSPFAWFSHVQAKVFTDSSFATTPIPLRDLRDLRAMLSPSRGSRT